MARLAVCLLLTCLPCWGLAQAIPAPDGTLRPVVRPVAHPVSMPPMRWQHRREASSWTQGAYSALGAHGRPLIDSVPRDVDAWCPGYRSATPAARRAFWVGFLSALAKHESTWRPDAVGGGGRWYGLLQILPATARGYGCRARSGAALKDGRANLSCAIRILAVTVPRDGAIALREGRWRGVAADWGPMRSAAKRAEMAAWLRGQNYCAVTRSKRPRMRPANLTSAAGTQR